MATITTTPSTLGRACAVALSLACLSVGMVGASATAASAHDGSTLSLRSGGSDDPPGDDHRGDRGDDRSDDHGGSSSTSDDSVGDDNGGSTSTSDDSIGDDNGGSRSGGDDDRVIVTGACSAGADWKLKVKTDDGRLEVEGEIDSNTVGEGWRWAIRHNGSVSDRGSATTTGRSGSFSIERKIVDIAGTDRVVFRAVHDGQTCRGVVNY